MTLDAAAQLLASALLLMQAVSANPALPQSVHDQTQLLAQSAITEATRAVANPRPNSATAPTCTIVSDKPNYAEGEIIVFTWTSTNAASAQFLTDTWRGDNFKNLNEVGTSGVWRRSASVKGFPFVTMKIASASGESAMCSKMVEVY